MNPDARTLRRIADKLADMCNELHDVIIGLHDHARAVEHRPVLVLIAPVPPKVTVKLVGENGNVFNIISRVKQALIRAGYQEAAQEFTGRCFAAGSYDEVLRIVLDYAEVQ